jgi:uncharacterized membrane protein
MKLRIFIVFFISVALISVLAPSDRVQAQTYTQYTIQLNSDCSATWTVKQVSAINGTVDTWAIFEEKVTGLASAAVNLTGRPMSINGESLQISTAELTKNSHTAKYVFTWLNFSKTQNAQLNVGDVFALSGFFNRLYYDGALQICYPANYTVKSVTPTPDQEDASTQTLQWFGTQFFVAEKPSITLQLQQMAAYSEMPVALIVTGLSATAAGIAGGFVFLNRRKNHKWRKVALPKPALVVTEEQKVLQALRENGGSANQSVIKEKFNFSKAKTSLLLSDLEKRGIVRRDKNGRDKIVSLNENHKSRKSSWAY